MKYPLAVFAPIIGARSETFIRRHMHDLLPGGTAVVAGVSDGCYGNDWTVEGPLLALDKIQPPRLRRQVIQAVARKAGWNPKQDDSTARVGEFLQKHGVRVVMGEFLSWSLQWLELTRALGIRFFGHAHGFDVSAHLREPRWRREFLRYNEADGIITMSEFSRTRLLTLGLDSAKVHVVPYGVDVPAGPYVRAEQDTVTCLVVSRMASKKGPILALDAFRRASKCLPSLRLEYVGEGELLPAAQQFIRAFNLGDKVTLHGGQPAEVVLEMMGQADIFFLHSITDPITGDEEGLPVAILEAMAHGLPVVSTRHAGIPEAVVEGTTGYLIDEGDTSGMAERIVALGRDPGLRRRMGEAGWRVAKERFSWERERAELLRVLGLEIPVVDQPLT